MTVDEPHRLRHEIEYTQRNLSADVDALTEKVTPRKIVRRRVDRAGRRLTNLRDKVMGTAPQRTASTVVDRASSAVSSVADAVGEAPQAVRRGTEGNPVAAGLIAFGIGWLAASLVPTSKPEREAAHQARDLVQEHADKIGNVAEQVKDGLSEPAHHAVDAVRSTVRDASTGGADATR
jgi:hypothetical protein